jgi:hypothetical protein
MRLGEQTSARHRGDRNAGISRERERYIDHREPRTDDEQVSAARHVV